MDIEPHIRMDTRKKNQTINMKHYIYIVLFLFLVGCNPYNRPTHPSSPPTLKADSVYTTADFRQHGDYYNTGHQVFAIDLLSEGLVYDSAFHISGSGCNLFLSDIFVHADLVAGHYKMDSVAKDMTFLRGMNFEGNITGTYLLHINEDKIQKIVLFTSGSMDIEYLEESSNEPYVYIGTSDVDIQIPDSLDKVELSWVSVNNALGTVEVYKNDQKLTYNNNSIILST